MDDKDRTSVPASDLELHSCNAPMEAEETAGLDTRVHIRVISYRKRKHDPDGVSVKAVLDGLTRRGILPDDSWDEIASVHFESRRCPKGEAEKTIIEIMELDA